MRGACSCISIGLTLVACSSFEAAETSSDGGAPQPDAGGSSGLVTNKDGCVTSCPAGAICDFFDRIATISNFVLTSQ